MTAHFMEYVVLKDQCIQGYTDTGDCKGEPRAIVHPERLSWHLDKVVQQKIGTSLDVAKSLIADVEMALLVWTDYGKGFIKKLRISPDAFIQMALQLTYFRVNNFFFLDEILVYITVLLKFLL